jgi:hypothetical protein
MPLNRVSSGHEYEETKPFSFSITSRRMWSYVYNDLAGASV